MTASGTYSALGSGTWTGAKIADSVSSFIDAESGGGLGLGGGPVSATLFIEPGALPSDQTVTVEKWSDVAIPDLQTFLPGVPTSSSVGGTMGFVFNLLPEGTTLNAPYARLVITYTDEALAGADEDSLNVLHFTGGQWVSAPIIKRNPGSNSLVAEIRTFSVRGAYRPAVADTDLDGCTDDRELGTTQALGGARNPVIHWDFFDVPTPPSLTRNQAISVGDISAVVARFGSSRPGGPTIKANYLVEALYPPPAPPAYHAGYDRTVAGPLSGPPDGAISVQDIARVVAQFGHSCL
jgi:hypothetical protein